MIQVHNRAGWERYYDCVLYYKDNSVSRALYLDPDSGWISELQPYRIKGRKAICNRSTLKDGYYVLANFKQNIWYDPLKGLRAITYTEGGEPRWL